MSLFSFVVSSIRNIIHSSYDTLWTPIEVFCVVCHGQVVAFTQCEECKRHTCKACEDGMHEVGRSGCLYCGEPEKNIADEIHDYIRESWDSPPVFFQEQQNPDLNFVQSTDGIDSPGIRESDHMGGFIDVVYDEPRIRRYQGVPHIQFADRSSDEAILRFREEYMNNPNTRVNESWSNETIEINPLDSQYEQRITRRPFQRGVV